MCNTGWLASMQPPTCDNKMHNKPRATMQANQRRWRLLIDKMPPLLRGALPKKEPKMSSPQENLQERGTLAVFITSPLLSLPLLLLQPLRLRLVLRPLLSRAHVG